MRQPRRATIPVRSRRQPLWLECLEDRTLLNAGALDPTFGTGGRVTTPPVPPNGSAAASAVAVQPDGKILVTGYGSGSLLQYNQDGSLDQSFGTGGRVTTPSGAANLALQSDGKIVVVATGSSTTGDGSELILLRYRPDGSPDSAFGTGGETTVNGAGGSFAAIQPDGNIVVAGTNATSLQLSATVARFNADGSLDQGFGSNGVVANVTGSPPQQGEPASGLALQVDGKILVLAFDIVTRFNTDGSLDTLFGQGGHVVAGSGYLNGHGLALQSDGRIVVAGTGTKTDSNGNGTSVISAGRLNTNGTIDVTFGVDGFVSTDFGPGTGAEGNGVAIQPDGRIIVAGLTGMDATNSFGVVRYDPNGSLDVSFGSGGKVTTSFGDLYTTVSGVALQPDGKIIVVGDARNGQPMNGAIAMARYTADAPIADPNQRFVTHAYLDLLGRGPDSAGLAFWTGLLNQGTSRTQVVQMIEASQEYHTDEVQYLYGFVLGRSADPQGMSIWRGFLDRGGTAEQLEFIFLGTDEYFSGRGGGSNTNFLQGVYRDVLGRTIDSAGAQGWGQALAAGDSRTVVAAEILASRESDMDEVQAMYARILHRPADSAGLNFFTQDLQNGVPNEAVLAALAGSDEYFARP